MIRALSNLSSKIFSMQLFLGRTSVVWHQAEHYNWASTLQSSTVQRTLSAARQSAPDPAVHTRVLQKGQSLSHKEKILNKMW